MDQDNCVKNHTLFRGQHCRACQACRAPLTAPLAPCRELVNRVSQASLPMVSNHNLHVDQTLPFELKALEAALAAGMKLLDTETGALEGRLQPSLDRLSVRVSTGRIWLGRLGT